MNSLQKAGGIAALSMAATFVAAFVVFFGVLAPAGYFDEGIDPAEKASIIADHHLLTFVGYLIPFVVWGFLQVVLALALYERLKSGAPGLAQVGAAMGLILATVVIVYGMIAIVGVERVVELYPEDPELAGMVWLVIQSIELTENEIVTGFWLLLVSWTAWRVRELSRALNAFGIALGILGMLTVIPPLSVLVFVFGPGIIVWYVWLGINLLRESSGAVDTPEAAAGEPQVG